MSWLYRFEAKSIQSYVLATRRLREMVGASALVEDLAREARRRAGSCIRMAAAGGATAEFPDDESLRRFAAEWPMWVDGHVPGLQIVQAWVPLSADRVASWRELVARLAAARNRPSIDLPEAGHLVLRAPQTGRPAVGRSREKGKELQDEASRAKERRAHGGEDLLARRLGLGNREVVTDFDEFGEGYLAVVHADGNGVGQRIIDRISKRDDRGQQAFSDALSEATQAAAADATRRLVSAFDEEKEETASRQVPVRPLVLGGDDFTIIVRARDAIPFADRFLRAFRRETERLEKPLDGSLTACAGIALVKPGFPFHLAYRLAEELCARAKRTLPSADGGPAAAPGAAPVSGLAFHRIVTPAFESLDAVLRDELSVAAPAGEQTGSGRADDIEGALLGGPWSMDELPMLQALAVVAARMPRGSLREWLRLVRLDRSRADVHWKRLLDILQRTDAGRGEPLAPAFAAALSAVGVEDKGCGFRTAGASHRLGTTPLLDAALWNGVSNGRPELWRD